MTEHTPTPWTAHGLTVMANNVRDLKPGGGKMDFCWLVWSHSRLVNGPTELKWLRRDTPK